VVESYTRVQSLFEQMKIARQNMTSAAETLRLTRERKELGVGTVLEDIQAQQEVVRARSNYINSVTELNQEQYGLMRAIGSALPQP
jgi:outer membrane protein TolC